MRESILTIPVSEVFEPRCGCPVCQMRDMLESRTVEYIMGAAMMEPDVRIETNTLGFCKTHFDLMLRQKNRLSLALMLQTHIQEVENGLSARKKLFESKKEKQRKISQINSSCFVCSKVDWGMDRILITMFELFDNQNDFRRLFGEQEFICLPHFDLLCSMAHQSLTKVRLEQFIKAVTALASNYSKVLYEDISHYCTMYDYRYSGKDADWGNSKDSIERCIEFLTSRK